MTGVQTCALPIYALHVLGGLTLPFGTGLGASNVINVRNFTNDGIINVPGSELFGTDRALSYSNYVNHGTNVAASHQIRTRNFENSGAMVASGDNELSVEADRRNRELFEEGMTVIKTAWNNERFNHSGKHFTFPPLGIPDRGGTVTHLTLVPRPLTTPVEVFQPVGSPATLDYVAREGHTGVFSLGVPERVKGNWDLFAEKAAVAGRHLGPGEGRCGQLIYHVGRTTAQAINGARNGHDEYVKFLSQYGRFSHYHPGSAFDYRPTVEDTRDVAGMAIGSVEEVADNIGMWMELLDLKHIVLFPDLPGLTTTQLDEQLHLLAEEVLPRVGVNLHQVG